MKFLLFLSLLSLNSWSMNKVPLFSGKLYIPKGFDTNDLVEITVQGSLPNSCYRSPTYEISRVGSTFKIHLYAYYVNETKACKHFSIPYQEVINLGILPIGTYPIELRGQELMSQGKIKIEEAISELQDDFQYGNIMSIIEDEDSRIIELVGTNPTNCLFFKQMDQEAQKDVLVLRPQFKAKGTCKNEPTNFNIKYKVPYLGNSSRGILLHVRVMGGRSLNYLFKNKL
jgi:hypothetical protein